MDETAFLPRALFTQTPRATPFEAAVPASTAAPPMPMEEYAAFLAELAQDRGREGFLRAKYGIEVSPRMDLGRAASRRRPAAGPDRAPRMDIGRAASRRRPAAGPDRAPRMDLGRAASRRQPAAGPDRAPRMDLGRAASRRQPAAGPVRALRIDLGLGWPALSDEERRARGEARARTMTVRRTTLADDADPTPVFGAGAISLVTQLARSFRALAGPDGSPVNAVPRDPMPVRFVPRAPRG